MSMSAQSMASGMGLKSKPGQPSGLVGGVLGKVAEAMNRGKTVKKPKAEQPDLGNIEKQKVANENAGVAATRVANDKRRNVARGSGGSPEVNRGRQLG